MCKYECCGLRGFFYVLGRTWGASGLSVTQKIDKKIKGYAIKKPEQVEQPAPVAPVQPVMQSRPEALPGATYKIKPPTSEHAFYITINDVEVDGVRRPFEIFVNSKNMEHYQWIAALTRMISAVFRHGGNIEFVAEELRSVFDPKGGYFKRGGVFMPSLVAEIGLTIENHLKAIGAVVEEELDQHMQAFIEAKREELASGGEYPANATVCPKCSTKAVVIMDGCETCVSCGNSKCN